jgi:hypothetical protein
MPNWVLAPKREHTMNSDNSYRISIFLTFTFLYRFRCVSVRQVAEMKKYSLCIKRNYLVNPSLS